MKLRSNLKQLLDDREISVRRVARDIEYRLGSVQDLYNDTMERYPRELLSKLCAYLGCSVGDILVIENVQTKSEPTEAGL
ncbi:helix-turn-helix domain-containing protein [Brevibacillus sp. SYSU BS000544]|uniref:helix-turn-helix domain-containing protein n=1 Tax=Brevibacillus sp. SYSU BS000544 TaxID=3416443 RepID=UPI003CE49013